MDKNIWQLQEAKARLSSVIRAAERYPQIISVRGKRKVVVLPLAQFRRLLATLQKHRKPTD